MANFIQAVAFDLGKVLIDFDWEISLRQLRGRTHVAPEQIAPQLLKDPRSVDYEEGRLTSAEYFTHQKNALGFDGSPTELESIYARIFTPIEPHLVILRALKPHYPLALISNTTPAHIEYAAATYDFFPLFDAPIYSYTAGAMKPKPAIYQAATKALNIPPEHCVFVDDLLPNCEGARALGWKVIHLQPHTDLRAELKGFGLKGLGD